LLNRRLKNNSDHSILWLFISQVPREYVEIAK
jgi:hypothetical protein